MSRSASAIGVVERSPITMLHLAIIALCACGFAIDLVELALGGALSAVFSARPYQLDPVALGWLLSSTYVGAIVGAPIFGWVADRIGPSKVLCILTCWIGIWSILSGLARTADELTTVRLLAGIGLGAYPPVMIAYLTDMSPSDRRGAVIFTTCGFAYLAPPLAIFAVRWLTPIAPLAIEGWRWPFFIAGVIACLAGVAMARLPEAPHWLVATGRFDALLRVVSRIEGSVKLRLFSRSDCLARRPSVSVSSTDRAPLLAKRFTPGQRLLILCGITFTVPIATVSFPLLTGPILLSRHFSLSDTLFYLGLATFGPIIGTLVGGTVIDSVSRRRFMAACALVMLASVGLFFLIDATGVMALSLIAFSLCTALYMPTMTLYGAELFTPSMRARRTSLAWVANRVAAAAAPALLVPLVHAQATTMILLVLALALATNIAFVVLLAPQEGID
jgi:putative MFS transporter